MNTNVVSGTASFRNTTAPATEAAASIDPTDRSMPPVAMTKVMPTAMIPTTLAWVTIVTMLS